VAIKFATMDFPLFVGIFSILIAAIGVAAMTLRDPIIGEVAGLAALAVLEFDLYAYFIGWPSNRPTRSVLHFTTVYFNQRAGVFDHNSQSNCLIMFILSSTYIHHMDY
jgi:hypothetical protein